MKELEDRIIEDGIIRSHSMIDVSSFLNVQIDPELMNACALDFKEQFENKDFDVILTVEASGIAPAMLLSYHLNKPLVILKKQNNLKEDPSLAQIQNYSFTKKNTYYITVDKEYIKNKRCILIDDFLAHGNVVMNVKKLLEEYNSQLISVGICVAKGFQGGYTKLQKEGIDLYVQATISSMDAESQSINFL